MASEAQVPLNLVTAAQEFVEAVSGASGVPINSPGLKDTPRRLAKAFWYGTISGYREDPADIFTVFENTEHYDEMVLQTGIPFYSTCEHHFLPFFGTAHIGYIPTTSIVGLSKLARVVDIFSRRLQTQEALTAQIADTLEKHLSPLGVMVVIEARHLCMESRGIKKPGTSTTTSAVRGVFGDPAKGARQEFLELVRRG